MLKFCKPFGTIASPSSLAAIQGSRTFSTAHSSQLKQDDERVQTSWDKAKPFDSIPGPSLFQVIIRSLPGGRYYGLNMSEFNEKIRDEYGNIAKFPGYSGKKQMIFITDPNDFETVFRNEGPWPYRYGLAVLEHYRKDVRPDVFKDMSGLVSEQGEPWSRIRSAVSPILLKPANVNAYIPVVDEITMEFCDQMKASRDENNELPANFLYDLNTWALESISFVALDHRLNLVGVNKKKNAKALNLIQAVNQFFIYSVDLELRPSLWKYMKTTKYKKLMASLDTMTETTLYYIEKAIERFEHENKKPETDPSREASVFEKLLKVDKHFAVVMAIDMMAAGVDTTSATTTYFLYHLAKNPEKQEKLRQELKTVPLDEHGKLKPTSFARVPYLRACFKEAMRLSPIISGNSRSVVKDIVIKGYQIPKGTNFVLANMLLYQDEKEFKDPLEFIPERWLNEKMPDACPASKASNPFVYLPFGFGPRSCIGKRIAEMEMSILTTRLLSQFHIGFDYPGPLKYRNGLVLSPSSDLKFKLTEL